MSESLRLKPIYRSAIVLILVVIVFNLALYLYAYIASGPDHVFGGLLYNTIDGQSYLLKMKQGYSGAWRFTLGYSCAQSEGAYVFLYYLWLGHMARWLGMSIPLMFHLARLLNAVILILVLARLAAQIIPDEKWSIRALWLSTLGSGMGYLALPFNVLSSNEIVMEGYPFLSMLGNPHFTLGMALFAGVILLVNQPDTWNRALLAGGLSLLLAIVQPFMVVSLIMVVGLFTLWKVLRTKRLDFKVLLLTGIGGGIYLLYQYWALTTDPVLKQWTSQNITPAPAWWDFILCISPGWLFFLLGAAHKRSWRWGDKGLLVIWLISLILLTYAPFALQRRFMAGIYIPLVLLAILAIYSFSDHPRIQAWLHRLIWIVSLPGAILFALLPVYGIATFNDAFFMTRAEVDGLSWLGRNAPARSLVLASPSTGILIPTWSDACVLYGHPFETLNQLANEKLVLNIFSGRMDSDAAEQLLEKRGVDYVFYGPRESKLGRPAFLDSLPVLFSSGDVQILGFPGD